MNSHDKPVTVTLVLVVRNEQVGLQHLLPQLPRSQFDDCFAIDGNSTDQSVELMRNFGIRTHVQKERGLGAAMIEARQLVRTTAFVYFHPDGNENPADLPRMAGLLRQGAEFVV